MVRVSDRSSEDALCCCEYVNQKGELSHLLACCCDCEAVDSLAEKCITCQRIPSSKCDAMWQVVEDRLRIPWFSGKGAVQVRLDLALPILLVPICLLLATINATATFLMLGIMIAVILCYYRTWVRKRQRQRTSLFFVFAMVSVLVMYLTFETVVIGYREILLWENLLLSTLFGLLMHQLYHNIKKDPGFVKDSRSMVNAENGQERAARLSYADEMEGVLETEMQQKGKDSPIPESQVSWLDSRPIEEGCLKTWCSICHISKPARSGHCPVCNRCVHARDHHCVWIDNCIGEHNHLAFLVGMVLFILCGCYGAHLTLTTVCTPEMYLDWFLFPKDCRFVYNDFFTSLSFVCACYTILACIFMSFLLVYQIILISQNVTSQEFNMATRRRWLTCWLFAKNNVNNSGFLRNWLDFLKGQRKQSYST